MTKKYDSSFDEALLEHYDEIGSASDYARTLKRMRENGYEPRVATHPRTESNYHYTSQDDDYE